MDIKISDICDPVMSCKAAANLESEIFTDRGEANAENLQYEAINAAGSGMFEAFALEFSNRICNREEAKILCAAGSGHNGADAIVFLKNLAILLSRKFEKRDFPATAKFDLFLPRPEKLKPLTLRAFEDFNGKIEKLGNTVCRVRELSELESALAKKYDLLVEGLTGMSFLPPAREELKRNIEALNSISARLKISVDIPAGTSDLEGARPVFSADATYATGIVKAPLFSCDYSDFSGRIRYSNIGFFERGKFFVEKSHKIAEYSAEVCVKEESLGIISKTRKSKTHKKNYGHLFIIAGSDAYKGAALMNARAALRSGVGLVTAFVPKTCAAEFASSEPSAIWIPCELDETGSLALENLSIFKERSHCATAILAGSGLSKSPETSAFVSEALKICKDIPCVLDADAITPKIIESARRDCILLTPHDGEFLRLAKSDKIKRVNEYSVNIPTSVLVETAKRLESTILLKGSVERISDGSNSTIFCPYGSPALSRGGSGDALAGLCSGLLARSDLKLSAKIAAALGALWLGLSAQLASNKLGETAIASSDILEYLPNALDLY